jgi:hypothetical protein
MADEVVTDAQHWRDLVATFVGGIGVPQGQPFEALPPHNVQFSCGDEFVIRMANLQIAKRIPVNCQRVAG